MENLTKKAEKIVVQAAGDVEDTLEIDQKRAQEQLRLLGIERAKRDEEVLHLCTSFRITLQ